MSLESRVVSKITNKVAEELEKGFNKKEDLDTYTKRTLHGKLAKKLAIKKLKSENNNELPEEPYKVEGKEDLLNIIERKEGSVGTKGNSNTKTKWYVSDFTFSLVLSLFVILFSVIGIYGVGISFINIFIPVLTLVLIWGVHGYAAKKGKTVNTKRELTSEEQLILKYNRVYEIGDKYFRYYEICDYDYFEEYLKEGKLKEVGLSIDTEKVSNVLTYNEILKFKEINNITDYGDIKVESVEDKIKADKVEEDKSI